MAGRFSVEAVFKAVDRITAPVKRIQNRVGKLTRSMGRGFRKLNRSIDGFSSSLKKAGRNVAVSGAILAGLSFNVLAAGADFEQAITNVGAVSLQTRAAIAPLEEMALSLGRTTKFTSTQAANAMEVLARAGFNANEILATTPAVLSAAAASGLEIADVANHVSNALKGMGLSTNKAAMVADVLALASARTNSSIGSLGESIRNVASTARELNIPFTEVAASVALLQDVGLDASVAGSALNTMLTKMAAPTVGMQKKMRRLGVSFKDAKGDMLPLSKVLQQINKASSRVGGNFDKVAFLAELVGLRGQKAASNLAALFETGRLSKLTAELENARGSAEKMAKIRMNTMSGSMLLLGSAIDAVKVRIFNLNSGPLKDAIDKMTQWVGANEKLISTKVGDFIGNLIDNFGNIVKWMKRIGTGLVVFFTLATILKTLALILTIVNLVMAANPIVLIVLGIMALIAAIAAVVIWWDELTEAFLGSRNAMDAIVSALSFLLGPIGLLIDAASLIFKNWEPIKGFFADLWGGVVSVFDSSVGKIMGLVDKVKAAAAAIVGTISNIGGGAADLFGFGGDAQLTASGSAGAQVVSPQDRVARSIEEQRTTSSAEVTIRDESGRAEVTSGTLGTGLSLQHSGAF